MVDQLETASQRAEFANRLALVEREVAELIAKLAALGSLAFAVHSRPSGN
jgi:hypothetical protein